MPSGGGGEAVQWVRCCCCCYSRTNQNLPDSERALLLALIAVRELGAFCSLFFEGVLLLAVFRFNLGRGESFAFRVQLLHPIASRSVGVQKCYF